MYDFCGIGNACIDIVARIDDVFLDMWKFPKGVCTYLSLERANALEKALMAPEYIPGGCAANTAACITTLGGSAALIGCVAQDAIGERFLKDMRDRNIHFTGTPRTDHAIGSTRIFCLTTPDAERTFAAYYGAQEDLSTGDLDETTIAQSHFLYLDGYALNARQGENVFLTAAGMSKKAGQSVVFSPSDLSILSVHEEAVSRIITTTDVLLCNEQEALTLAKTDHIETALNIFRKRHRYGAITIGAKGVIVFDQEGTHHVPAAVPPGPVVDTNGAGDSFAGGFLYAMAKGYDTIRAAVLGNMCAASVITHYGARPVTDYKLFLEKLA